jgi:hypothetical protein
MSASSIQIQVIDSFDSRALLPERWSSLLSGGDTDTVFLTWWWQKTWWECFGRGRLLLVLAERRGRPIALAPLFADSGMIFFVGSGGSDYLDFLGDISGGDVLPRILDAAREAVPDFVGFRFYHVPDASRTGPQLCAAGESLHLRWYDEGSLPAPQLSFAADSGAASKVAGKTSLSITWRTPAPRRTIRPRASMATTAVMRSSFCSSRWTGFRPCWAGVGISARRMAPRRALTARASAAQSPRRTCS